MAHKTFFLGLLHVMLLSSTSLSGVRSIGVCNGRLGGNLPSEQETVQLYKSNGITGMRHYSPNPSILQALRGSNIQLIMDVPNDKLNSLASSSSAAKQWVQDNILNYYPDVKIKYIAVGNEVNPNGGNSGLTPYVLPAMQNVYNAIAAVGLQNNIKVSTATFSALVSNSYPPSHGVFTGKAKDFMDPIISFLVRTKAPLLANIYPYFSYTENQKDISLQYALFTAGRVVVTDDNGLGYTNLFDALLDAIYAAVEKSGGGGVEIVVSESGWPSEGGSAASTSNASTYLRNLINHVKGGSPKKPSKSIETYIFAMYDENQKDGLETEKHFGLFNPTNKQPKYQISFN